MRGSGAVSDVICVSTRRSRCFEGYLLDGEDGMLTADAEGKIALPNFPLERDISDTDWALKLALTAAKYLSLADFTASVPSNRLGRS